MLEVLLLMIVLIIITSGCETYKKMSWTPDSINYTISRDRQTGELVDYFGISWTLK